MTMITLIDISDQISYQKRYPTQSLAAGRLMVEAVLYARPVSSPKPL